MNRAFSLGVVLALALLIPSCSATAPVPTTTPIPTPASTPGPTNTATPSSAATTASPSPSRTPLPPPISLEFPTGKYFHRHPGAYCVLQLNKDRTWAFYFMTGSVDVSGAPPTYSGTYNVEGDRWTETSITGMDCPWPGTYTWYSDGQSLAFQVAGEEKCPDRQRTYEASWTRVN